MVSQDELLEILLRTVIPGGIILNSLRGSISNQPKKSDLPEGTADETSTAHTSADDLVQEVALAILLDQFPDTCVNAEENTPRVKVFEQNQNSLCYHLDPLDGTLSYIRGNDGFSIGAAFSRNEEFIASVIYFPALDHIYMAARGSGISMRTALGQSLSFTRNEPPTKAYIQKRAENLVGIVTKMSLEPFNTMGAHHGMIAIAEGRAKVLLYRMASPHDFGIPQVIVEESGGICTDLEGNPVTYNKDFGRLPWFLAFFDSNAKDEFFEKMSATL